MEIGFPIRQQRVRSLAFKYGDFLGLSFSAPQHAGIGNQGEPADNGQPSRARLRNSRDFCVIGCRSRQVSAHGLVGFQDTQEALPGKGRSQGRMRSAQRFLVDGVNRFSMSFRFRPVK
jgi:hypothetical protein